MAFTQDDVDAIKDALKNNVSSVTFADGRRVEYKSTGDMLKVLDLAQADVNAACGISGVSLASVSWEC